MDETATNFPAVLEETDRHGHQLYCPDCRSEWINFERPQWNDTDDYTSPTGLRGSWAAFRFWCENCDADWCLIVGFHKGQSYLTIVPWYEVEERR